MKFSRSSGILLHPTSLPSKYGIGDLGQSAYDFVDFMAKSGIKLWQVLPLGYTSYGDSPYFCVSAFAGNPLLVSPGKLVEDKLLPESELEKVPDFPKDKVDFGWVIDYKFELLKKSFDYFQKNGSVELKEQLSRFAESPTQWWMNNFTLYMAIKKDQGDVSWLEWEPKYRSRDPKALEDAKTSFADTIEFHKYVQYIFFRQWTALKKYTNEKGIEIIGDIPIFVAMDSADTWANTNLFYFDEDQNPFVVAGVPPDYFSKTGQLWGNPLYRWDVNEQQGYRWWIERFKMAFAIFDRIRIDHFRGFESYWEIKADAKTAIKGRWVKGPNEKLFYAVQNELGELPIIAEDLGIITPQVKRLRDMFNFPGMKILQFAFGSGNGNEYLPHNHIENCVIYTGTHDNDTIRGWYKHARPEEKHHLLRYLGMKRGRNIHWHLIQIAMASVADTVIIPMQDFFGLGEEARMNIPSTEEGNWHWRFTADMLTDELGKAVKNLVKYCGRI